MTTNQANPNQPISKDQKIRFWAYWSMIMFSLAVLVGLMINVLKECS